MSLRITEAIVIWLAWMLCASQTVTSSTFAPTTIWNDMRNAFKAVTNDTQLIEHVIPEMYESTMQLINPSFVFKLPNEHAINGYEMLVMPRSFFEEPIFPNLTNSIKGADGPINLKTHKETTNNNEWIRLGLPGWRGGISPTEPMLQQSHLNKETPVKSYTNVDLFLDIKTANLDGHIQNITIIPADNSKQADMLEYMTNTENIYIARVNDPFGYSLKWQLKNTTHPLQHLQIERGKRDVAKLYSMIKCSTGCDPLIYKGYGCYCGFGGHGVPADGIDRCCRQHDKCYEFSNCISYLEYFVPYVWKCYRGKPLCAIDHGEWGGPDSCASRLCECDLRLSRCLRQFYCPNRRAVCRSSRSRRLQNLIFFK